MGIRSKSQITENVLNAAKKLQAIGCFCIGVNQVNLKSATQRGVAVFNAPYSNTRSVAELVIGASIMLIRKIPDKNAAAHNGFWQKDSSGSYELRGKTIGNLCNGLLKGSPFFSGSSGKTSTAAPAISPFSIALASVLRSITSPLA